MISLVINVFSVYLLVVFARIEGKCISRLSDIFCHQTVRLADLKIL